jgi:hypothetical protein
VREKTALAISEFVNKRGKCLKVVDLSMNKGIPVRILEDINTSIARNIQRAARVKEYFMKMFKRICAKYDMNEDYLNTIDERKRAVRSIALMKEKNKDW